MAAILTSALERSLRVGIQQEWLKPLLLGVIDKYARKEGSRRVVPRGGRTWLGSSLLLAGQISVAFEMLVFGLCQCCFS